MNYIDRQIVNDIINQLGGNRFLVMTGTKNLVYNAKDRCLMMHLTRNKSRANRLNITVDPSDTYTVEFFKYTESKINMKTGEIRKAKRETKYKMSGVYCDQLQRLFEEVTGLDTHL